MATVTISLPDQFAKKVDEEAKSQGFSTRSEFVRSLLRKYFAVDELKFEVFEPQPIEEIKLELAKTGKYNQKFIESVTKGLSKSSKYVR
jgi:Arc/MetJ-type ribon-helix-helix transcriptional regulator